MARKTKAQKANFFVEFWNGDLSLAMSYWGVGVGLGVAIGFSIGILMGVLNMGEDAMWGFVIPFQIYTVVGIWRSADKHKGSKFWAVIAKIAVVLGIVTNLASMLVGA